jgi:hypothetical protein
MKTINAAVAITPIPLLVACVTVSGALLAGGMAAAAPAGADPYPPNFCTPNGSMTAQICQQSWDDMSRTSPDAANSFRQKSGAQAPLVSADCANLHGHDAQGNDTSGILQGNCEARKLTGG